VFGFDDLKREIGVVKEVGVCYLVCPLISSKNKSRLGFVVFMPNETLLCECPHDCGLDGYIIVC
jgi:hypothetical protein